MRERTEKIGLRVMAKYFKEGSYDPTKVHQTPGYDAGAQYKHNRNIPTSHAIRQLGAE